jgi:hypothetical protein
MEVGMMCAIQAGVWTKLADLGDLVLLTKLQGVALYLTVLLQERPQVIAFWGERHTRHAD